MRRFPLEPLRVAAGCATLRALAARLGGLHVSNAHRQAHIGLSPIGADRAAMQLGLHPGEVWPEWWEEETGARCHRCGIPLLSAYASKNPNPRRHCSECQRKK